MCLASPSGSPSLAGMHEGLGRIAASQPNDGLYAGDPAIKRLPCALQANEPVYDGSYIGTRPPQVATRCSAAVGCVTPTPTALWRCQCVGPTGLSCSLQEHPTLEPLLQRPKRSTRMYSAMQQAHPPTYLPGGQSQWAIRRLQLTTRPCSLMWALLQLLRLLMH